MISVTEVAEGMARNPPWKRASWRSCSTLANTRRSSATSFARLSLRTGVTRTAALVPPALVELMGGDRLDMRSHPRRGVVGTKSPA